MSQELVLQSAEHLGAFERMMVLESEVKPMQCAQCGTQIMVGQRFCSKCGQPVASAAPSSTPVQPAPLQPPPGQIGASAPSAGFAPPSRVARHISVLGILWIIFSGLRLIPGLALIGLGHMHFPFMFTPLPDPVRLFLGPFLGVIGLLLSGFAIAGLISGIGLMTRSPWARTLAIVLGCISLIHFPFGTALGIYTLWVLAPAGADEEYRRLSVAH